MNENMQMNTNGFDGFVKRCNYFTIRNVFLGVLIANISFFTLYYLLSLFVFTGNNIITGFITYLIYIVIPVILLILVSKKRTSSSFYAPILVYLIIICLFLVLAFALIPFFSLSRSLRINLSFKSVISLIVFIPHIIGLFFVITTISNNKSKSNKSSYLTPTVLISISSIILSIIIILACLGSISHFSGIGVLLAVLQMFSYVAYFMIFMILPIYLQKISEGEGVLTVNYQNAPQYNSYANPNGGMQGDGFSNPNNGNSNSNDSFANARNSIDYSFIKMGTGIHVLLFLFTCGIWSLVWIYKVTRYLNCFDNNSYREPINKLLLCMFVPFYSIYWFYVTGKRIDEINRSRNVHTDTGGLLAILAFLVSIAAYIVAQIKIDQLDMEPGYNNYQQNNMPQYNTPQGPQGPQGMNQQYNQNYQQPVNTPNQQYNTPYQQANAQGYGQGNYQPNTQPNPQANTNASTGKSAEQIQELERLKELLDNGVINQEEFEKMKSDILN